MSQVIAKDYKPYTIRVLPAAKEIVRCVLGDKDAKEIKKISFSNDNVKRRIDNVSLNVKKMYCFI